MTWLTVLSALVKVVLAILEIARERKAEGADRTGAIAESAIDALELIRKASDARRAADDAARDLLPGCATTTASVGTDAVACSAFEPIRWSKKDTDETIRQVKEHNVAWTAICGPKK